MNEKNVSLVNIGSGAAIEKFDNELMRVVENMLDPNVDPTEKRKITLTVVFTPKPGRDYGDITIDCKSKLANPMAYEAGQLYYGMTGHGEIQVAAVDPRQGDLFPERELPANVSKLKSGQEEAKG